MPVSRLAGWRRVISWLLIALLPLVALRAYIGPLPDTTLPQAGLTAPSILILDRDGRVLYEMMDPTGGRQRPVSLNEIPLQLRQAVIATEDARFYTHPGVDPLAIVRSAYLNLQAGQIVSGASTIPQQLARMLLLPTEERAELTLRRKLREATLAIGLSIRYSRDEILAKYLNQTYFGAFAYGVEAASQAHFGKPVQQLDLAECALLAGLIQSPYLYDPLTRPEAALQRQRVVLDLMVESGYITAERAEQAAQEPLRFAGATVGMRAPHAVVYSRAELERLLTPEQIAAGGLRVYTSIDLPLHERAEAALRRHLERLNTPSPSEPAHNVRNGAVVVLDLASGGLLAMVGSPDYDDAAISGAVNAAMASRQPGSAVKPLTYAAAFERGWSPASTISDVPVTFITADGKPYTPINYDYRYHGVVSLRQALANSYNIATVKLLDQMGVGALSDMAFRLGVPSLGDAEGHGLAMTLGSSEVQLLQLTNGYAALARQGGYLDHHIITRIVADDGDVLYQQPTPLPRQVLDERVAFLVTDVLADDDARLPAFGAHSPLETPYASAVKTGTTTDWRDNWTIGYTSTTVVGVWVGNADGSPMKGVTGVTGAAPIWQEVMQAAHPQPPAGFTEPPGLARVRVCALSGKLPGIACAHTQQELFLAEAAPTEPCGMHHLAWVDAVTGEQRDAGTCEEHQCVRRAATVWPAEAIDWALTEGLLRADDSAMSAIAAPQAADQQHGPALAIVQPLPNARYHLVEALPRESQAIEVNLQGRELPPGTLVTLLLNGQPVATWDQWPLRWLWQLEEGQHTLLALAALPDGSQLASEPIQVRVEHAMGGR